LWCKLPYPTTYYTTQSERRSTHIVCGQTMHKWKRKGSSQALPALCWKEGRKEGRKVGWSSSTLPLCFPFFVFSFPGLVWNGSTFLGGGAFLAFGILVKVT
jgi:hypothetical protein